jgi:sulfate adenylyltransferase
LDFPSWDLRPRQQLDLELLLNGALSPLTGFMNQSVYDAVLRDMTLDNGLLWPVPIVLDVEEATAEQLNPGDHLALRDVEGVMLAVVTVESLWRADKHAEAHALYGTDDPRHPGVAWLLHQSLPVYVGGPVEGLEMPSHHSFKHLYESPAELRQQFKKFGWGNVVAYHPETPIHRAQHQMSLQATADLSANLLIHPVVAVEDEDYYHRVRCYNAALPHFPRQTTMFGLLPVSMRRAGVREVLWHGIVSQNYGCSHMLVTPDYGAPTPSEPALTAADWETVAAHQDHLALQFVPVEPVLYSQDKAGFVPVNEADEGERRAAVSDAEYYRRLQDERDVPAWFTFPEVLVELRKVYRPRSEQGFTLFFTGLSGAGKSTIARAVIAKLMEIGGRPVTLLDGDIVRKHLSSELGFSREHRNINVRRIGYVASEITKNGGIAVCAPIAPYASIRQEVREMISAYGGFIEIYVSTPLEVCESRDRKGLYAKARAGIVKEFTGISDPYEPPGHPELAINTAAISIDEAAQKVFIYLEKEHYIGLKQ